jgi:apolipoprotein N-acyltransferase
MSSGVINVLVSSVLFAVALPNELFVYGSPIVGVIALIPLYRALRDATNGRQAARLGALFGLVSTLLTNFWLMFFRDYSVWTIGGTALGYTAYNFLLGGLLWLVLRAKIAWRPVLFAMLWTLYEYAKSIGFLGYPWGLAAYPFNTVIPLIQIVDITGIWFLSLIVVYLNAALAELIDDPRFHGGFPFVMRHATMVVLLFVGTLIYGYSALSRDIPADNELDLLLVQQNVDMWETRDIPQAVGALQELTIDAINTREARPDLVVWSETSLRYPLERNRSWYESHPAEAPFTEFVRSLPSPLLTGAPYFDPQANEFYNAALLLSDDARIAQWYGKQQLVPFAELTPFWDIRLVRRFFQEVVGISAIWARGPGYRLFEIPTATGSVVAGTPICFEDGFARVTAGFVLNGADVLINLTNNAWSRTNSAQVQHFVAARFRAIETRRSLVRSTNAGYTAVVDPWGRVTASIPMFEQETLRVTVPVYRPRRESTYLYWGDYLPQALLVLFAVLAVVAGTKKEVPKHLSM